MRIFKKQLQFKLFNIFIIIFLFSFIISLYIEDLLKNFTMFSLIYLILIFIFYLIFFILLKTVFNNKKNIINILKKYNIDNIDNKEIKKDDEIINLIKNYYNILKDIELNLDFIENKDLKKRINTDLYQGKFKIIGNKYNKILDTFTTEIDYIKEIIKKISEGNFNIEIEKTSKNNIDLLKNLNLVKFNLISLLEDTNNIKFYFLEENKEKIIDIDKYNKDWQLIGKNINIIFNELNLFLEDSKNLFKNLKEGNLDCKLQNNYKGNLLIFKNNIEDILQSIKKYINNINFIINSLNNKKFDTKITEEYKGDFNILKDSINKLLENFIIDINKINNIEKEISTEIVNIKNFNSNIYNYLEVQNIYYNKLKDDIDNLLNIKNNMEANIFNIKEINSKTKEITNLGNDCMVKLLSIIDKSNKSSKNILEIIQSINNINLKNNLLLSNVKEENLKKEEKKEYVIVLKELKPLIIKFEEKTKNIETLFKDNINKNNEILDLSNKMFSFLWEVIAEINKVSNSLDKVADFISNNKSCLENIKIEIYDISKILLENINISKNNKNSIKKLIRNINILINLIDIFKIEKNFNNSEKRQ